MESIITHVKDCEIYFGNNAGKKIEKEIKCAKKSIKVLSPYVSSKNINILKDIYDRGVQVYLATVRGFTPNEIDEIKTYRDLIHQHRITNHINKQIRLWGRILVTICFIVLFYFVFTNLKLFSTYWKWEIGIFVVLVIVFQYLKCMRVYSYSYEPTLPFTVYDSPHKNHNNHKLFYIHSKIYVIDDTTAFIGSVNFTHRGFYRNHETCIRIDDKSAIQEIEKQFELLMNSNATYTFDVDVLGKAVYSEPIN